MRAPYEIDAGTADRIRLLQLFFVVQVICGHIAMIGLPPFASLTFNEPYEYAIAIWRITTRFGAQGAYGFIFLSGYFLVPQLHQIMRRKDHNALRNFLLRRFRRIYPVLLAALFLTLVLDNAGIIWGHGETIYRSVAGYDAIEALTLSNFTGNLLSLQPTFSGSFGSNGPLWTLGYIVQFYAVAGGLAFMGIRYSAWAITGVATVVFVAMFLRPEWALLFLTWLGGGALRSASIDAINGWPVVFIIGLLLFVVSNLVPAPVTILISAFAVALMVSALARGGSAPRLLMPLRRLSDASYPLYAFHFPILMVTFVFIGSSPILFVIFGLTVPVIIALFWQHITAQIT